MNRSLKGIKQKIRAVTDTGQTTAVVVKKLNGLTKIIIYVVLAIFVLLVFAFFMIRRNQRKSETKIVDAFNNSKIDVRTIAIEHENNIFIVTVEKRQDGYWYSPFISKKGQPIYRMAWKDIKKSVAGAVKNSDVFFQKQKKDLIAAGKIKVKEKE